MSLKCMLNLALLTMQALMVSSIDPPIALKPLLILSSKTLHGDITHTYIQLTSTFSAFIFLGKNLSDPHNNAAPQWRTHYFAIGTIEKPPALRQNVLP